VEREYTPCDGGKKNSTGRKDFEQERGKSILRASKNAKEETYSQERKKVNNPPPTPQQKERKADGNYGR